MTKKSLYKKPVKILLTIEQEDKEKLQRAVDGRRSVTSMIQEAIKAYIIQNDLK